MARIKRKEKKDQPSLPDYSDDIHRPVSSLAFLFPLVVVYEIGTYLLSHSVTAGESRVIAFQLLNHFLALFGATKFYLPGLALLVILGVWHLATGDTWRFRRRTIGLMALESLILAVPLVVLNNLGNGYVQSMLASTPGDVQAVLGKVLLSIGAGIYEELLFRLMLISVLSILLIDLVKVPEGISIFVIVLISATMFSLYHYLGVERFAWSTFTFRAFAGGYLAGIFILRGFGVNVGCHVMYNILAIVLNTISTRSA